MLNLDTLNDSIGSVTCNIKGTEITLYYRQATHPEIISFRYLSGRLHQKMIALETALKNGSEPDVQVEAEEIGRVIKFVNTVVTSVDGIEQDWSEVPEAKRLSLLALMPESSCWDIASGAISGASLEDTEKKP